MVIIKTEIQEPQHLHNVLVKYTMHYQDFWTRGFLCGKEWTVMTWDKTVVVPKDFIKEWMPLPVSE